MNARRTVVLTIVALTIVAVLLVRYAARRANADARFTGPRAQRVFDPTRDAAKDLQAAQTMAGQQHKNILMDVGGNWCPWCLLLDRTVTDDDQLHTALQRDFVLLHVNWSSDNKNDAVLNRYPEAHGYPAWYVLAPDGHLLKAESTTEFQIGQKASQGYDREAIGSFFGRYGPR